MADDAGRALVRVRDGVKTFWSAGLTVLTHIVCIDHISFTI